MVIRQLVFCHEYTGVSVAVKTLLYPGSCSAFIVSSETCWSITKVADSKSGSMCLVVMYLSKRAHVKQTLWVILLSLSTFHVFLISSSSLPT